jgi:hypothetical protein
MPVRANLDYYLYLSPMRGFVKADNVCDMLQRFATFSRAIELSKAAPFENLDFCRDSLGGRLFCGA